MFRLAACTGFITTALLLSSLDIAVASNYTPKVNYTLHCQGCHLVDGSGTEGKVPALKNEVGKFLEVTGGREFLIQVPGTSQSPMSDAEIAEVLKWILENFSADELPADFVPYTSQEVSIVRPQPLTNVSAAREDLLAQADRE